MREWRMETTRPKTSSATMQASSSRTSVPKPKGSCAMEKVTKIPTTQAKPKYKRKEGNSKRSPVLHRLSLQ